MKSEWLSVSELSELLERGETSIRKQIKRAGLKRNKDKKYNVEKVIDLLEEARERDCRNRYIEPNSLEERKIILQCEILQAKLDKMYSDNISKEEHDRIIKQSKELFKQSILKGIESCEVEIGKRLLKEIYNRI